MARFLISKGADLKAQDIAGNNAFTYAVILRQEDIALKTLEFVDINQLVGYNIFDGKPYIYEYYIFETKKDWHFANYLHLASRYGQTKIIKKLLAKGLKIDTLLKDKQYKMDILQIAIYYGDVKTVKFLIENGANQYKLYNSSLPWGSYKTLLSYSMIVANKTKKRQEIIKYLLSLPKTSWYKKYENIDKINKFLNKKIEVYKDNSDERLAEGIKNNDYLDVIHSTKHNDKLISSLKQMLKLKHNINKEIFKKYNYEGTLLVEYFKAMENNINIKDIKKLVSLGATLGNSQQALENIYLLYSNRAVKYILKDKLFQKQIINLHTKYNITDIAIKIYKNERRSNHRIELMFELVYKYNLNFDFEEFKKVVKKDDNYIRG
jgi:ankyrin repeat protein